MTEHTLKENVEAGRFELHIDGELVSFANFSERDGVVTIPHVETKPERRGQGNAGTLMDLVLDRLRDTEREVVALCPFAAGHLRKRS